MMPKRKGDATDLAPEAKKNKTSSGDGDSLGKLSLSFWSSSISAIVALAAYRR